MNVLTIIVLFILIVFCLAGAFIYCWFSKEEWGAWKKKDKIDEKNKGEKKN